MKNRIAPYIFFISAFQFLMQFQLFADELPSKAFWMFGSTLTSNNQKIVDKMADNYVNEIYILVKGTGGMKINAEKLTDFITKAHVKSIKVHLWYTVFQDNAYLEANPDAHVYHSPSPSDSKIRPYRMTNSWVNPFYPGYKEYVVNNIEYFLNHFDCDGIHLDYIRYGHLVYSFDPYSLKKAASLGCDTTRLLGFFQTTTDYEHYAKKTGLIDLYSNKDPDVVTWVDMRKDVIYGYIAAVRDIIERLKPGIKLTAAFMPEGAIDENYANVHYAQNYALHSTLLDMISPMSYFKSYGKSTSWLKTIAISAINRVDSKCKISTGLQGFGDVTATEMDEQIASAIDGGSSGVIIFRYESIETDSTWNVIKNRFGKLK